MKLLVTKKNIQLSCEVLFPRKQVQTDFQSNIYIKSKVITYGQLSFVNDNHRGSKKKGNKCLCILLKETAEPKP